MTHPIVAMPTGTNILFLGARAGCRVDLPASGTLAVWKADCGTGPRTTVTYTSMGTDMDGRLKFVLDANWLLTDGKPTVGRWDGTLTTATGCVPVRFQLGGRYTLSTHMTSSGYSHCEPTPCLEC
jgi:hypothetical protein